jgi:hypothetical protein
MKSYNLSAKSIEVAGNALFVIQLGEAGRARVLNSIKCPLYLKDGDFATPIFSEIKASGVATKPSISAGGDGEGWLARISTLSSYVRGADGNVSYDPTFCPTPPRLLARGSGAFGLAGGTGRWDDLIVAVEDNTILRVKPSRGDAYYLYFQEDRVSQLTRDQLELLDLEFNLDSRVRI